MLKNEPIQKAKGSVNRFSFPPNFCRDLIFQKWSLFVILSLVLALQLAPQWNTIHPKYTVGMILDFDIRADRDLLVEDKTATERKRIEALQAIEPLYEYDKNAPELIRLKLRRAFTLLETNYYRNDMPISDPVSRLSRPEILKKIKNDFETNTDVILSDQELAVLHKYEFSPAVADKIFQLLESFKADSDGYDEEIPKIGNQRKGPIIRDDESSNSKIQNNIIAISDPDDLGHYFEKPSLSIFGKENDPLRHTAVSLAVKLLKPHLVLNKSATEKRRKWILDQIKPVYYKVKKNELMARAGDPLSRTDLNKLEAFYNEAGGSTLNRITLIGFFFTIMLIVIIFYQSTKGLLKDLRKSNKDLLFLALVVVLQIILIKSGIFISESIAHAFSSVSLESIYFALPFAASSLLVAVFLNRPVAFTYAIFSAILVTFLFETKIPIFLFAFLGSAAPAYHSNYFRQRSAFFKSGLFAAAVNILAVFCLTLLAGNFNWIDTIIRMAMGCAGGMLSGMIVAGITPVFEALFGYTTDIKLLELSNLNQPLLQRMIVEAPGTYHHSIIVASMVEAAAESIKANPLLAKVSAYYHDIGKLNKPLYFIENQQGWKNKHDKLSPKMSSLVIISHVKEGCELAQKHKLGKIITDIIRQHHGMSIVSYFYEKAQKDKDPSIRSIPETDFRYPGPKPQTKEAGLVLLGDVVEASSRTLSDPTPSRIRNLVEARIKQIFTDGQLNDCELTLNDVNRIAESFIRTLMGIFHQRIEYTEFAKNSGRRETNGHSDYKPAEKIHYRY